MVIRNLSELILPKRFIWMIAAIATCLQLHCQVDSYQIRLAETFDSLADNVPKEIAYIQTSKDIYETGEDLWFKVYILDAQYLFPSMISKTLYLELLNESNMKVIWEEKYEIQDGFASGRVYLQSTLPDGDYILAAYTPNSFYNDTSEFKCIKKIKIKADVTSGTVNTEKSNSPILNSHPAQNAIQFTTYPEGGELISGISNKLAFKAVSRNGNPLNITGTLFENDIPLVDFKSSHAGMGSILFKPDASRKYIIRLSQPSVDSSFLLPQIKHGGMTMSLVNRNAEALSFRISHSQVHNENDFYVRVQCRGIVYGMTYGKVKGEIMIKIPLSLLPQGIAEVTLFNSDLLPVAERLVYVNNDRKLNITTELSKEVFPQRGKVKFKISVKDENGKPAIANLGVTVFDKLYQNRGDSGNILSHFLLSSQLKGRIYNPSYYFNSISSERDEALDLLMLTQGWRRYIWNEENIRKFSKGPSQIIFDGIKGDVFESNKRKKAPGRQLFVIAFSPNKDSTKLLLEADSTGKFVVSDELLKNWENDYVYLKPFGPYDSKRPPKSWDPLAPLEFNFHIILSDPFKTIDQTLKSKEIVYPSERLLNENNDTSSTLSSDFIRIKEVTIKGRKIKPIRGKYLGVLDSIAKASDNDYVCKYNVLNCPRHDPNEPGTTEPVQGREYFVIYNYNTFSEYTRLIRYWRPRYSEDQLLKINNLSRIKAYYGKREFYQPDYDRETGESIIPDFRNTLFWDPSVVTDEKGEATLSFFCSDINTDFVGRIEGVSDDGLLGAGYFHFAVRKVNFTP